MASPLRLFFPHSHTTPTTSGNHGQPSRKSNGLAPARTNVSATTPFRLHKSSTPLLARRVVLTLQQRVVFFCPPLHALIPWRNSHMPLQRTHVGSGYRRVASISRPSKSRFCTAHAQSWHPWGRYQQGCLLPHQNHSSGKPCLFRDIRWLRDGRPVQRAYCLPARLAP